MLDEPRRYLPPGTSFLIPPFALHRDPRNFSFPDCFWPERWLVASGQLALADAPVPISRGLSLLSLSSSMVEFKTASETTPLPTSTPHVPANGNGNGTAARLRLPTHEFRHNDTAFLAFSHGPLNCVGKGLGMQEMRMVVTALVQRFEMRLAALPGEVKAGAGMDGYEEQYRDFFVSTRPEVMVVLERRGQ